MARDPTTTRRSASKEGVAGGDQEGVPQARAPVPPRPQPGRPEGRGALQGDLRGLRRARRSGEAQAVRPRRRAVRRRRPGGGGFGGFRPATSASLRRHPLRPLRRRRRRRRGAPRRRAPSAAATSRPTVSISFEQAIDGAQVPLAVPTTTSARPARHRRQARHSADVCPSARAAASSPRARGCSRSPSRARARRLGHDDRGAVPDLHGLGRGANRQALQA